MLATLVDGAPTEGDSGMLIELRVGLRAHPAGPTKAVADPGLKPLALEMGEPYRHGALRLDEPRRHAN